MYKVTTLISELIPLRKKENLLVTVYWGKKPLQAKWVGCVVSVEEYNRKRVDSVWN